jgi:hypothetical protein
VFPIIAGFVMQITTIGLDIAKNMFQVHGIDASEKVVEEWLNQALLPPQALQNP